MKYTLPILIFCVLIFSCKQKLNRQNPTPESQSIETDEKLEKQDVKVDSLIMNHKSSNREEENEEKNPDLSNETNLSLHEDLKIVTSKQLNALKAFEVFLEEHEKFAIDQVNTILFLDADGNGNEKIIIEYSVILFPGTDTWGLRFLYGFIENGRIVPLVNETLGGKGERVVSFKTIDKEGVFWFDTLTYSENDAMCCPSIKGVYKFMLKNGDFKLIEN